MLTGPSVTFTWSAATGATQYYLSVGSTGVGSTNVYNSGWRTVTSWTATGLPANGETLYVRLSTDYGGALVHNDYTYTAATAAVLTSPAPDTTLSGSIVTFTWTPATGATQYYISIGSTGVGSSNIYNSGWRDVTSWTATGLPANGETLYVRLSTDFGGTAAHNDYTYTAH
jgi:serine protease